MTGSEHIRGAFEFVAAVISDWVGELFSGEALIVGFDIGCQF